MASIRRGAICALVFSSLHAGARACTTLVVGKAASQDGSVFMTHSDDGEDNGDARLCSIPAGNHLPGDQRPIYFDVEVFPRFIGYRRGSCYQPREGETPYKPIGFVPQVKHTFAYFEATYGLVNEHGVGIGESTCSGVFGTTARGHGGKALLSVDSLTRIALERTATAREAVKLMGALAEEHGFYGAGSFEGSAESLMVGDADEAFIFHILPDPTGESAIWAAQRVPDDHVGVVANMFVIRSIDFNDSHAFLYSESVKTVALEKGWWKPGAALDFTAVYSDGEYAHKFYSGRRVWGAYRKFGVMLPDNYTDLRYEAVYPPTARPGQRVGLKDLFAVHRSYYEGTAYDMTRGLAAGPWGNPDRWAGGGKVRGNWERSISLFRTTTTHVVQARRAGQGAVLWYGPHAAAGTVFMPLASRATLVPAPYADMDPHRLSRGSAYWAHRYVFNIAKIKYSFAMQDVRAVQSRLEEEGMRLVRALDERGLRASASHLNNAYARHAASILEAVWKLPDEIIAKYADGWVNGTTSGYPAWWLKAVGYEHGPPPPPSAGASPGAADRQPCTDEGVERCVGSCTSRGFAACAAGCVQSCGPGAAGAASELVV